MLKKVMHFLINEDDGLVNIKNLYLVCVTLMCIVFYVGCIYEIKHNNVAVQYIQELESAIEATGVDVADICGGDGYVEYHNK